MIRQLDIENVKSFSGRHEIELAPITLVLGPNSAGKSTLLQSLAVLKQTLEPLGTRVDLEQPPLALSGELVDLGSFLGAVHGHDRKRELYIGVRFENRRRRGLPPRLPTPRGAVYAGLGFGYHEKRRAVVQRRAVLGDGSSRVEFLPASKPKDARPAWPGTKYYRLARGADKALLGLVQNQIGLGSQREHARQGSSGRLDQPQPWTELYDLLAERLADDPKMVFSGRGFFPSVPAGGLRKPDERTVGPSAARRLDYLTTSSAQALVDLLSDLAYLGPLRAPPTRFQLMSSELPTSVGASGEHTATLLARDAGLADEVNYWLGELGIDYGVSVEPVAGEHLGVELGDVIATRLQDTRSGLPVTPQDVGFGISQLLPVVVQLLVGQRRTVCVEQPEIHVHPRLQARVGDLVIASADPKRGNQVIVETHSEHLMLRLQRRLRERKPDWLTSEHIKVIYVDTDSSGVSRPQQLRLNDEGHFVDEWPHGFVSERIGELFAGSSNPPRKVARRPMHP